MTETIVGRARQGAEDLGLSHVDTRLGDATPLPVDDPSVDVLISNGVLNLRCLAEMLGVVKFGGRVQLADIVLGAELEERARHNVDLWTA